MKIRNIFTLMLVVCGVIIVSCSSNSRRKEQKQIRENKTSVIDTTKSKIKTANTVQSQKQSDLQNTTNLGKKIIVIDSLEYYSNKVKFRKINEKTEIKKIKGIINVPTQNSKIVFRDNTSDENLMEYSVIGTNKNNKWVLILGQDYDQDYYYLVNQEQNKVDTLVGSPMIFGNKILCLEGSYTDSPAFIEIWKIAEGDIKRIEKFSLRSQRIETDEIYIKNNTLYVKSISNEFVKIKI